jgi:hypothetical protein
MPCLPGCIKTTALSELSGGSRIMISQPGNKKYPEAHTPHPQCKDCAAAEYAELMKDVQKLKDKNVLGPGLSAKWEKLLAKTEQVLRK